MDYMSVIKMCQDINENLEKVYESKSCRKFELNEADVIKMFHLVMDTIVPKIPERIKHKAFESNCFTFVFIVNLNRIVIPGTDEFYNVNKKSVNDVQYPDALESLSIDFKEKNFILRFKDIDKSYFLLSEEKIKNLFMGKGYYSCRNYGPGFQAEYSIAFAECAFKL